MIRFFGHGQSILQVFETSIALSMVKSVKSPFFQTVLVPISWTLAIYLFTLPSHVIIINQFVVNTAKHHHIAFSTIELHVKLYTIV